MKNESNKNVILTNCLAITRNNKFKKFSTIFSLVFLVSILITVSFSFSYIDSNRMSKLSRTKSVSIAVKSQQSNPGINPSCPATGTAPALHLSLYMDRSFDAYTRETTIKNTAKQLVSIFADKYSSIEVTDASGNVSNGKMTLRINAFATSSQWQSDRSIVYGESTPGYTYNYFNQHNIANPFGINLVNSALDKIEYSVDENATNVKKTFGTPSEKWEGYWRMQATSDPTNENTGNYSGSYPVFSQNSPASIGGNNLASALSVVAAVQNAGQIVDVAAFVTAGLPTANPGAGMVHDFFNDSGRSAEFKEGYHQDDEYSTPFTSDNNDRERAAMVVDELRLGQQINHVAAPNWEAFYAATNNGTYNPLGKGGRAPVNVLGIYAGDTSDNTRKSYMTHIFGQQNSLNGWYNSSDLATQLDPQLDSQIFNSNTNCHKKRTPVSPDLKAIASAPDPNFLYEASKEQSKIEVIVENGPYPLKNVHLVNNSTKCKQVGQADGVMTANGKATCGILSIPAPSLGEGDDFIGNVKVEATFTIDPKTQVITDLLGGRIKQNPLIPSEYTIDAYDDYKIEIKRIKLPV